MSASAGGDRRLHARVDVEFLAMVYPEGEAGGKPLFLYTRDLSATGAYIRTAKPLATDAPLTLRVILPTTFDAAGRPRDRHFHARARVVRVDDGGMAVAFESRCRVCAMQKVA